jgi:hypothetical protein
LLLEHFQHITFVFAGDGFVLGEENVQVVAVDQVDELKGWLGDRT